MMYLIAAVVHMKGPFPRQIFVQPFRHLWSLDIIGEDIEEIVHVENYPCIIVWFEKWFNQKQARVSISKLSSVQEKLICTNYCGAPQLKS